MSQFETEIAEMVKRYDDEVRGLNRSMKSLSTSERLAAQTHANVKEAAANELRRIMVRCGVKQGARK